MALFELPLVLLPVHMHPEAVHDAEVSAYQAKQRDLAESVHRKPFAELRIGLQAYFEDAHKPRAWLLNDIAGWTVLGLDRGDSLCGDLYCLRKDIRHQSRSFTTGKLDSWVHLADLARQKTYLSKDNAGHVRALMKLIDEAKARFRAYWPRWQQCEVWLPPFGLECLNWVEAIRQAKDDSGR